jgi:hypothetical protein
MAENKTITTNREKYTERLKAKYPDKEYADEEAIFGQINEDYENYDNELSGYKEREKVLSDLFASNPRSAAFLMTWRNGGDPIVEMIRKFGDDFKAALEDPDKVEEIAAANKEYADRIAREREYEQEYQKNIAATLDSINAMQQEEGLDDDEIDNAMSFLMGIIKDGIMGKFTTESISMALKALNHDDDVAIADREGEVRGRNAKIEERLRKGKQTDGTANLGSKHNNSTARTMPDLGGYGPKSIWERGKEVRKSYK